MGTSLPNALFDLAHLRRKQESMYGSKQKDQSDTRQQRHANRI